MKKTKKTLVTCVSLALGLLSFATHPASAGVKEGHGGIGVVCRDPNTNQITEAKLLDLFEGPNLFGLTIRYSTDPYPAQIDAALGRLPNGNIVRNWMTKNVSTIQSNTIVEPRDVILLPTDDSLPVVIQKGCEFEQIAVYSDDEFTPKLLIDQNIFSKLTETDKAALFIHETLYLMDRTYNGATDSLLSRKATAALFSTSSDDNALLRTQLIAADPYGLPSGNYVHVQHEVESGRTPIRIDFAKENVGPLKHQIFAPFPPDSSDPIQVALDAASKEPLVCKFDKMGSPLSSVFCSNSVIRFMPFMSQAQTADSMRIEFLKEGRILEFHFDHN